MLHTNRRHFLASLLAAGAAPRFAFSRESTNDQVGVAIVGLGTRGRSLIREFQRAEGARVVALCDPDRKVLDEQIGELRQESGSVAGYVDFRKLLDSDDVDAVAIATPNHWHSLMGIWACEAGKDIYIEKPVSHNVWEGQQLLAAVRRHKRVAQTGTQNRSDTGLRKAIPMIHSGRLGSIKVVRGLCFNPRPSIGKVDGAQPVPPQVDYDLWSGPAPIEPVMRQQFHYDWHWDFTYGNGDVGNQGVHEMDICRWALGASELPRRVISAGGRLGYQDDGNTPNTLLTVLDYEPAPIVFEVRGLPAKRNSNAMDDYRGQRVGVVVECTDGYLAGGRGGASLFDSKGNLIERFAGDGGSDHVQNFITAVRNGDPSELRAEVCQGVLSSALCHFANVSYRVGEPTEKERIVDRLQGDAFASDAFGRMVSHLAANEVDLEKTPVTLGRSLQWKQEENRFADDSANQLLSREYRSPFVVPNLAQS